MFQIATADELVDFVKDFTGSTNTQEIKKCIFMAELSMRNIELPALRCDPYDPQNIGIVDSHGRIPIPGDMNKPILFFKQGVQYQTTAYCTGNVGETTLTITTQPNQSLTVGMSVTGTGIANGATITAFPTSSTITLSSPNTSNVDGWLLFVTPGAANPSSQVGPWIVYDRIGDRDIITQSMIAQLYLQPVNVPAVIRGKFSEVGAYYEFLPYVASGDLINMYYYKAWPLLFSPADDVLISTTGTITTVSGSGPWTGTITGMTDTSQLTVGDTINATNGSNTVIGLSGIVSGISGVGPWTCSLTDLTDTSSLVVGQTIFATDGTTGIVSNNGTVQNVTGVGPWLSELTDLTDSSLFAIGQVITATDNGGTLGGGGVNVVTAILDSTTIQYSTDGGTGPSPGLVIDVTINGGSLGTGGVYTVQSILSSTAITVTSTGGTTPIQGLVSDVTSIGGSLGSNGTYVVASIPSSTSITFTATDGTTPYVGTITDIMLTNVIVDSNAVLSTWPEGYVYATLREYYIKRHNDQDAAVYASKFDEAWKTVEDQNNLGKWSGGHTRLTSVWQPRQYRQYNIK